MLDPRDPLLHSERTQGFTADPDYWNGEVFVYVGRNQNLKDLEVFLMSQVTCKGGGVLSYERGTRVAGAPCCERPPTVGPCSRCSVLREAPYRRPRGCPN